MGTLGQLCPTDTIMIKHGILRDEEIINTQVSRHGIHMDEETNSNWDIKVTGEQTWDSFVW